MSNRLNNIEPRLMKHVLHVIKYTLLDVKIKIYRPLSILELKSLPDPKYNEKTEIKNKPIEESTIIEPDIVFEIKDQE
jgi:hypothetical protein